MSEEMKSGQGRSTPLKPQEGPWYAEGLRFMCTGCGVCCSGKGRVWLSVSDIERLAEHLELEPHELVARAVERVEGRWALREDPLSGDCHFLKERRCQAYEGRPRQCRTFPWWPSTLSSQASWAEVARVCEGVDAEGAALVPLVQIEEGLREERSGRSAQR